MGPCPAISRSMSRMGDAKYASEMIPTKIKVNPTIEAALPDCPCCIGSLPGAGVVSETSPSWLACDSLHARPIEPD